MARGFSVLGLSLVVINFALMLSFASAQTRAPACSNCAVWNLPQAPFRIYGNTYYVGPHGLSAILIVSDEGDVLIDGALPESASVIASNIRSLGFRIQDVKLIVNSHVHFDHAGGIAELQRLSRATVMASPWSAAVLTKGGVAKDDPQYGALRGIEPVVHVKALHYGEEVKVGSIALTPHSTPGHTPGGTSWTWRSCEGDHCVNLVYADSVSAVAREGFKFLKNSSYPGAVADFNKSFAFLETVPCDILITPHPEASNLWERLKKRQAGDLPDPLIDGSQCRQLAQSGRDALRKRLADESGR